MPVHPNLSGEFSCTIGLNGVPFATQSNLVPFVTGVVDVLMEVRKGFHWG